MKKEIETKNIDKIIDVLSDFLANKNSMTNKGFLVFLPTDILQYFTVESQNNIRLVLEDIVHGMIETTSNGMIENNFDVVFAANSLPRLGLDKTNVLIAELFGVNFLGPVVLVSKKLLQK